MMHIILSFLVTLLIELIWPRGGRRRLSATTDADSG
jgi:hypothetical protein